MTKSARLLDLYRRFLKVHNSNIENDEIVHNTLIESKKYGVSQNTIKRDIKELKDLMLEIAKRDYDEQSKNHQDFYIFVNIIEFNKSADIYWMRPIAMNREVFEQMLKDEEIKRKKRKFISLSKKNAKVCDA